MLIGKKPLICGKLKFDVDICPYPSITELNELINKGEYGKAFDKIYYYTKFPVGIR